MSGNTELIRIIWMFLMLFLGSISDIRNKSVSVLFLAVTAIGCIAVCIPGFDASVQLPGLLPGSFLLLISRASSGAIGEADAYAVCFIGFTFGIYAASCILMLALLMITICAVIMISMKKAGRRSRIPLYPYLSLAFILRLILLT